MKNVTVFGASGGTGRRVVERALAEGHTVTAVYRSEPSGIAPHPRLKIMIGNPLDANDVRRAVAGAEVVIHAIGPKRGPGALLTVTSDVMANLIPAMKESNVRRLLFVSAWGTGATRIGFYGRLLWLMIGKRMADKERAEAMVRSSGLDWVIVLPTILTDDPPRGRYQAGPTLNLSAMPKISRADVADLVVRQVEHDAFLGKAIAISN